MGKKYSVKKSFSYSRPVKYGRKGQVNTFKWYGKQVKVRISKSGKKLDVLDAPQKLLGKLKRAEEIVPYKGRLHVRYPQKKQTAKRGKPASKTYSMKTKWGNIEFPKGLKPVVVEVKSGETKTSLLNVNRFGLGYQKKGDLEKLKEELTKKIQKELPRNEQAEVTLAFPRSKKTLKFNAVGEQPITPPVIHHPAWPPPENLVEEIKKEMRKTPNRKTASDLEAMAYLNTASLAAPLSDQLCRIYFHLTRKYLKGKGWKKFDGSMSLLDQHKTLSEYDRRELNKLKDQIFRDQQKILRERRKQAKKLRKGNE